MTPTINGLLLINLSYFSVFMLPLSLNFRTLQDWYNDLPSGQDNNPWFLLRFCNNLAKIRSQFSGSLIGGEQSQSNNKKVLNSGDTIYCFWPERIELAISWELMQMNTSSIIRNYRSLSTTIRRQTLKSRNLQ